MKKLVTLLLLTSLITGCSLVPKVPSLPSFGKKSEMGASKDVEANVAAVVAAQATRDAMEKTAAVEQKAAEDKKKMEEEYAKTKAEMQKAYNDLREKDLENFAKISELNYGIYFATQEKKKVDINTTIAHLRSKEVMMRTDKLTDAEKAEIQKEVADEKQKTVDQLYIKYKATIDLAVNQKSQLDDAEALIVTKEKEKAALKEANRLAIEKIEAEKKFEVDRVRAEAADQVRLLKEAQQQELMVWLVRLLGGIGILFIIIGVLFKSFNIIFSGITFLGLAYLATSVPMWIIGAIAGGSIVLMGIIQIIVKNKKKAAEEVKVAPKTKFAKSK
jgi:predicted phage tail protein